VIMLMILKTQKHTLNVNYIFMTCIYDE